MRIPPGKVAEKVKAYSANPAIAYAEPDYRCQAIGNPDDYYSGMQWSLNKIEAFQAWDVTNGSRNVNIAILDSGVDVDHPDLAVLASRRGNQRDRDRWHIQGHHGAKAIRG